MENRRARGQVEKGERAEALQVSLVLPVQSEAGRLGKVLTRLARMLKRTGWRAEVIVVDDGSEDGSGEAAARWKPYFTEFGVVRHARRKGRGVAMRTGALLARGRLVVLLDARSETSLEDTVQLVECVAEGADVAVASRRVPGAAVQPPRSFIERASETTYLALSKLMVPIGVRDSGPDLIALRRNAARNIAQRSSVPGEAFVHEWLALAGRLGFHVAEVPVRVLPDADGEDKPRPNELVMLRDLWKLRQRLGSEKAPKAAAVHQLLHETGFVRLDRRKLLDRAESEQA